MKLHIDIPPTTKCKHPEWTYGEICVKCNDCGRFNRNFTCINCGKRKRNIKPDQQTDWGFVELYDTLNAPICPDCRPLFKEEDCMNYPDEMAQWGFSISNTIIPCRKKDFLKRVNLNHDNKSTTKSRPPVEYKTMEINDTEQNPQ